jgi:hypothetical protein
MKLPSFVLALALIVPSSALADPITLGGVAWSSTAGTPTDPSSSPVVADPFWSGLSWDCDICGVGYLLDAYNGNGLEYLHSESGGYTPFRFDEPITTPTLMFNITALMGGVLSRREDGAFTYDNGTGNVINSWDDYGQFALFRLVGPETTRYFVAIEDILVTQIVNDRDYNDYVATFTPQSVPEPSTLLLMGCSIAVLAARKKMRARKERA